MITVNNKQYPWEKGQTLEDIIHRVTKDGEDNYLKGLDVTDIAVVVNGTLIDPDEFKRYLLSDGDCIKVVPRMFGG